MQRKCKLKKINRGAAEFAEFYFSLRSLRLRGESFYGIKLS